MPARALERALVQGQEQVRGLALLGRAPATVLREPVRERPAAMGSQQAQEQGRQCQSLGLVAWFSLSMEA